MAIRLIGIDVDGTLLDSQGRLLDANRDAIHDAVAAGIHVALVTGRSYPFARPVAEPLPAAITLIVSNGAVERSMDGDVLARRLLDRTVAREVLGSTRPYRDAAALIFDRDDGRQVIFESMDWEHPGRRNYWQRNQRLIAQAVPLEAALVEDPIQVMFNGGVDTMRQLAGALRNAAKAFRETGRNAARSASQSGPTSQRRQVASRSDTVREAGRREARGFAVSLTEYVHRDFSLIDITAPEATKGRALAWRAAQLSLTRDEVMAIGDNFNDLEMLQFAGTPVVMANAVEGLKDYGWHVTGHQNEAGLAQAIRRFAL